MQVILVLVLFLALLIAVFALQNQEMVEIKLFFWEVWVSKILVILGSAFAGALAVLLAGLFRRRARERREVVKTTAGNEPQKPAGPEAQEKMEHSAAAPGTNGRTPGKEHG